MERSEQLNELAAALAQAQANFPSIMKTEEGKIEGKSEKSGNEYAFTYRYADLASTVETVRPILAEHGLSVSQYIGVTDAGNDTLTTVLLHKSGQWMSGSMRLYLKKQDAQGQGSAITYARRYSFMAALGLVADDDDDGVAASQSKQRSQSEPKPRSGAGGQAKRASQPTESKAPDRPIRDLIEELDQQHRQKLVERMAAANYPDELDALRSPQEKQVRRWIEELQKEQAQGVPF